jgi:myo-inositol-1(or 4)-monophosphatase
MTFSPDLAFIVDLSKSAAAIALKHYGHVARQTKTHIAASEEAVTIADREVQAHIVRALKARFPTDGIIGEEDDAGLGITVQVSDPMGRVWVIDPIDGTNNFIGNFGNFAVCIGLLDKGIPILGVVHDVTRNITYAAAKGEGMWTNDLPTTVPQAPLTDGSMVMLTSNLLKPDGTLPTFVPRWMSQNTWKIRVLGTAAIEAAQVAAGVAHGAVTMNGKLWDVAAPAALVLEAGGHVLNLQGKDLFPFNLKGYTGAKVPFLATAPAAQNTLVREITAP